MATEPLEGGYSQYCVFYKVTVFLSLMVWEWYSCVCVCVHVAGHSQIAPVAMTNTFVIAVDLERSAKSKCFPITCHCNPVSSLVHETPFLLGQWTISNGSNCHHPIHSACRMPRVAAFLVTVYVHATRISHPRTTILVKKRSRILREFICGSQYGFAILVHANDNVTLTLNSDLLTCKPKITLNSPQPMAQLSICCKHVSATDAANVYRPGLELILALDTDTYVQICSRYR